MFCSRLHVFFIPALSRRDLPKTIDASLKAMAAQNHRSMQERARLLIKREVRLHQTGAMERARSWRSRRRDGPIPRPNTSFRDLCCSARSSLRQNE